MKKSTRDMIDMIRKGENLDLNDIANKLEELMQFIDDMLCDHYVDNLEWYMNRCWELEDEIEKLRKE